MKQGLFFLLLLVLANVAIVLVMSPSGKALKTPATPAGILHLEFAPDSTSAQNIINVWENNLDYPGGTIPQARKNIYLDFLFIPLYTTLLYFVCKLLYAKTRKKAGKTGMMAALAAGGGDIAENLGMLFNLAGNVSAIAAMLSFIAALIKWFLVAVVVVIIIYLVKETNPEVV